MGTVCPTMQRVAQRWHHAQSPSDWKRMPIRMKAPSKGKGQSSATCAGSRLRCVSFSIQVLCCVPLLDASVGASLDASGLSFFICKMVLPSPGMFKNCLSTAAEALSQGQSIIDVQWMAAIYDFCYPYDLHCFPDYFWSCLVGPRALQTSQQRAGDWLWPCLVL